MAEGQSIDDIFVSISLDDSKLKKDLADGQKLAEAFAVKFQKAFDKSKITFDNKFAKMKLSELEDEYKRLKAVLDKKISLNVSTLSLKLTKDQLMQVEKAMGLVRESAKKPIRPTFDDAIAKLKISQLQAYSLKLRSLFEKKIAMNVDSVSLDRTREKLASVDAKLKGIGDTAGKTGDKIGRWSQIATGINQTFELVRNSFALLKQEFAQSVSASNNLKVLSDNFKGTAEDIQLFKTAVAGTVSESGLIKLSNQASDLGIDLKQQAILFSLAEDAADKYGTSTEEGFGKIVAASEGSIRGVKSIGIETKKYQERVDELAKSYGDSIANLDADIQKQIRLQAIIELSGVTFDQVKNKVKDNADKYDSLSVSVEAGRIKIGQFISSALLPLINGFDNSGKGVKDFISIIIGMGGIILNLIPLITSLIIAKSTLSIASTKSAAALTAETVALNTNATAIAGNTIATGGWLSKVGVWLLTLGKFVPYIAAASVVLISLSENMHELKEKTKDVDEQTKKTIETLKRLAGLQNPQPITTYKKDDLKKTESTDSKGLLEKILATDLTSYKEAIDKLKAEYVKKRKDINDTLLKNEKEKSNAIIEINKKEKEALKGLDVEYGFAKETDKTVTTKFVSQMPKNYTADQIAEYDKLKFAAKGYAEYSLAVIEMKYSQELSSAKGNSQAILKAEEEKTISIAKLKLEAFDYDRQIGNRIVEESLKNTEKLNAAADKDLEEHKKKQKEKADAIDNYYSNVKVKNEDWVVYQKEKLQNEYEEFLKLTGNKELAQKQLYENLKILEEDYLKYKIEKWKEENEVANAAIESIKDGFIEGFGSIRIRLKEDASAMENIFVGMANSFIAQVERMIAEWLSFQLLKGIAGLLLAPLTGGASAVAAIGMKMGGEFYRGSVKSYSQIPKFATGTEFNVPSKYTNDSFLMRVSGDEKVRVTPANRVGDTEKLLLQINNAIDILNSNFVSKNFSPNISIRTELDGRDITKSIHQFTKLMQSEGRKF